MDSKWVGFEISRARIASIVRENFRVLVFIVDPNVRHSDLPDWMKERWIPKAGRTPRDVARYLRNILTVAPFSEGPRPIGRGAMLDHLTRELQNNIVKTKKSPNVFLFSGHDGIGRRTVERMFLRDTFSNLPDLNFGPEFQLPQFADVADLYRALCEEVDQNFSITGFERDIAIFNSMTIDERVDEVCKQLAYFGQLGQAVTVVSGNGIFDDVGILKPWVTKLFERLADDRTSKLCIISTGQAYVRELAAFDNVLQFPVSELSDPDIKALIAANAPVFGIEPQLPNDKVIQAIGGHAGIALTTTRMIAQKGVHAINDDMRDLFRIQDKVLSEALDFENLTTVQKDALSILSWVPALNAQMLKTVIQDAHGVSDADFADVISSLVVSCLVRVSGPNYLISAPIRSLFRRKHGFGSEDLREKFATALKSAWDAAEEGDQLRTDLLDSIVYMASLEGGTLDPKFKRLMLPSALQEVVKTAYDNGHNDRKALNHVVEIGLPSMTMKMDEATREEILSYVVRAQTRLEDNEGALATLAFMDGKLYRSRFYLRAFYIRLSGGDLRESVRLLREARGVRKYRRRVVSDLALCLLRLGRWRELNELLAEEDKLVNEDPVLLDFKIGMYLAKKDYSAARIGIENLRTLRYEDGRAASRTAMLLMREKHDFKTAVEILTDVLERKTGGQDAVRRLRAIAAAHGGRFDLARRDAEALKRFPGGKDTGYLIEARILLEQKEYDRALREVDKVNRPTAQDHLLRARILEAKGSDIALPLSERRSASTEAQAIRSQYPLVEEFEAVN